MLQWELGNIYLFKLWFSPDICPSVGLLDQRWAEDLGGYFSKEERWPKKLLTHTPNPYLSDSIRNSTISICGKSFEAMGWSYGLV